MSTVDPRLTGEIVIRYQDHEPLTVATFVLPADALTGDGPSFPYRLRITDHPDAPQLVEAIAAALTSTIEGTVE